MGIVNNITASNFPKQGDYLNQRTKVCFHFDTSRVLRGTVVRDDAEAPWMTIIRLDDGRFVLASECQYSPDSPGMPAHMRTDASADPEDHPHE